MNEQPQWSLSRKIQGWPITIAGNRLGITRIDLRILAGRMAQESPAELNEAVRQLGEYLAGRRRRFDLPIDNSIGTRFQRQVWKVCRQIPYGRMTSYGAIARRIGRPRAARAVGRALGANPIPLVIPCHRVVGANGKLTGFSAGLQWKRRLLALEDADPALWDWTSKPTPIQRQTT